jgi:hypothetical protein
MVLFSASLYVEYCYAVVIESFISCVVILNVDTQSVIILSVNLASVVASLGVVNQIVSVLKHAQGAYSINIFNTQTCRFVLHVVLYTLAYTIRKLTPIKYTRG